MYIVVIAWFYVVVLMAVAEATSSNGTLVGALVTFVLYGVLPLSIVVYILGTPGRRRQVHARNMQERAEWEANKAAAAVEAAAADRAQPSQPSTEPDASGHAAGSGNPAGISADARAVSADGANTIAPVRKEP